MQHQPETRTTATRDGAPTVFRRATAADSDPLRRLAELDSAPQLTGEVLVAERAGELVAAIGVETGSAIANPFQRTARLVTVLALQRQDLHSAPAAVGLRRLRGRKPAAYPA